MKEELVNIRNQALARIEEVKNSKDLEHVRAEYLGRNGALSAAIKDIQKIDKDERAEIGIHINETKKTIERFLAERLIAIAELDQEIDLSAPGIRPLVGHLHLVTQAIEEISQIFARVGFVRRRYPEIEWDWYAFEALGFGPDHPARDEWETFFVNSRPHPKLGRVVLTPHTSNGQVREMEYLKSKPPIRMINIAKTYRRQIDASHVPMFHQFEGLVVDRDINVTHLRGTLELFARAFFGEGHKTRIRPYDFPFTEPSFEVDISCGSCNGEGCKVCTDGWLEIGGAGMVHPSVLKSGKIDPKEYRGFAFGWGVERVAMVRAGLMDIREIYNNDLRFLEQF